jgi:transcriptional regulator with XRE-family HTH domain
MPRRTQPHPLAAKIGARVRALRLERNMSIADLANASGVSRGHISSLEQGLLVIRIETLGRLADGLALPLFAAFPIEENDEIAQLAELARRLSTSNHEKLRRAVTRMLQSR